MPLVGTAGAEPVARGGWGREEDGAEEESASERANWLATLALGSDSVEVFPPPPEEILRECRRALRSCGDIDFRHAALPLVVGVASAVPCRSAPSPMSGTRMYTRTS